MAGSAEALKGQSLGQQPRAQGEDFDAGTVVAVSIAHMGHDMYPAFLAPLLPLLIPKLGMTLAAAGVLSSALRAGSLLQPLFGLLADRTRPVYFVAAPPALTALCMSLLGLAPSYLTVALLLLLTSLSVAAFHPAAAATITRASGSSMGRGSGLYTTGGRIGFALGPLLIVSLVNWLGPERSFLAAIPGLLISLALFLRLRGGRASSPARSSTRGIWHAVKAERRALLLLSGFVMFRSMSLVGISTFYPTYLTGRGSSLLFAGLSMTVWDLAGSVGTLAGGTLSDRLGRRRMLLLSQLISGPLLYLTLNSPEGTLGLLLLAAASTVAASTTPVELTLFQELLPGGRSTAAGIWYLLSFEGSVVAALLIGVVADSIGLSPTLSLVVFASMLGIPFTLALPRTRQARG